MRFSRCILPLGLVALAVSLPTLELDPSSLETVPISVNGSKSHEAQSAESTEEITSVDDRKPSLYTQDYGSCMSNSPIQINNYHGAFYRDNMSLTFSFDGMADVHYDDSLILMLSVIAYGERRVSMKVNACQANIHSLCSPTPNKSISAFGVIPVSAGDVAFIPTVAFQIPDFEGKTLLQIFSTKARSEVACVSAGLTNGASMSQPAVINFILIAFLLFAFALSAYPLMGEPCNSTINRIRYTNSVSVFLAVSIIHHVFYSGSISVDWPRILISFWSNFSWPCGMIYNRRMQQAFSRITRDDGSVIRKLINGNQLSSPFGAFSAAEVLNDGLPTVSVGKRDATEAYIPQGHVRSSHLALPGIYEGFSGTLSEVKIPIANAMLTGFIMFLMFFASVAIVLCILKCVADRFATYSIMRRPTVDVFRRRWRSIAIFTLGRVVFASFFMLSFLTIYQFALRASYGPVLIALVFFLLLVVGTIIIVTAIVSNHLKNTGRTSSLGEKSASFVKRAKEVFWQETPSASINGSYQPSDDQYDSGRMLPALSEYRPHIGKSTFLGIRFRQSRWWLFMPWLIYEFLRACFLGGAVECPLAQIAGSLVLEVIMVLVFFKAKPFEDTSLPSPLPRRTNTNTLLMYLLSASKFSTAALSIAFLPHLRVSRITATIIGVIIIILQGVLVISLLASITLNGIWGYFFLRPGPNTRPVDAAGTETETETGAAPNANANTDANTDDTDADALNRPPQLPEIRPSSSVSEWIYITPLKPIGLQ